MSPDKILHKIQLQIKDLAPALELFVEHTIQPTTEECEDLQKKINELQDSLVIYRYLRQNKELSPSFNIHAKISEKEIPVDKPAEPPAPKTPETPPVAPELKQVIAESIKAEPVAPPQSNPPSSSTKNISIGINDKFRFVNELFSQNASEYAIAVEQLNTVRNWHDAEIYLNSLKSLYGWREQSDITKHFYALVKRRFD